MVGDKWVLWAEDEPGDVMLIQHALENRPGPRVEFVPDGRALLDRLAASSPDLVVLDLKMPRMGGIAALREIRRSSRTRTLSVCVFSSGALPDDLAELADMGVSDIVQKPIQFEEFRHAVHRLLMAIGRPARSAAEIQLQVRT